MVRAGWGWGLIVLGVIAAACGDDSHGPGRTPSPSPAATATTAPGMPTATMVVATPTGPSAPTSTSAPATATSPPATPTMGPPCTITPGSLPFERTECRPTCQHYNPLKHAFFGETHLHTAYSFDASTLDTRNLPPQAYTYAKGGQIGLPPWADTRSGTPTPGYSGPTTVTALDYCMPGEECEYSATRTAQLPPGRALDFAALTDHSEQFGENNICLFEGTEACSGDGDCTVEGQICDTLAKLCVPQGYNAEICNDARQELSRIRTGTVATIIAAFENTAENPSRPPGICGADGSRCRDQARLVWQEIIDAAEQAYDRTDACTFTSLIAYEYTAMATSGRCSNDLLPCWNGDSSNPDIDCAQEPVAQTCETSFVGSEGGDNLHRNIIFRNDDVIDLPLSNIEAPLRCGRGDSCDNKGQVASPAGMLLALREDCIDNPQRPRCDVLSIPHNSNMSRGDMFLIPENVEEARIRRDLEPLVEIMQIKGQSECRYSPVTGIYWSQDPNAPDELCAFENVSYSRLNGAYVPEANQDTTWLPPRAYVREALKNGIAYEAEHGVNPFRLGFVGGLDNHNGTPGQSEEIDYARHGAHGIQSFSVSGQILNEKNFLGYETNGGALTGVWAEENSRDAIFTGLKNRETFATSGTRPVVRFFGGYELPDDMCGTGSNFAQSGYDGGVPMGGCLSGAEDDGSGCKSGGSQAPSFAVMAMMDPGWPGFPGTQLQRIQIIKGWVDAEGQTHDQVYEVAGDPDNGASVDLQTCTPTGPGAATLCAQWTDPDFDPAENAFYYARVLENPSCRWNQYYCNARNIDCQAPMGTCSADDPNINGQGCDGNSDCGQDGVCILPVSYTEYEYQQCCSGIVPNTIQQRAWTSPIWYSPQASGS